VPTSGISDGRRTSVRGWYEIAASDVHRPKSGRIVTKDLAKSNPRRVRSGEVVTLLALHQISSLLHLMIDRQNVIWI